MVLNLHNYILTGQRLVQVETQAHHIDDVIRCNTRCT